MKKIVSIVLSLLMVCLLAVASAEHVDTYSSASVTKSFIQGDELTTVAEILAVSGADIATKAQAAAPDYVRMYDKHVLIMSVNPDGCAGLSTIGYWRYVNNREGAAPVVINAGDWEFNGRAEGLDQVVIQLTEGQNALNLYNAGIGGRASILVTLDSGVYLLHLNITDIHVQEYSKAAYDAGEFASGYSGADREADSYYFIFDVLNIEKCNGLLF